MKKIICLLLSLFMVVMFTACDKEKTSSESGIDLEYFANLGKIPECNYNLGTKVQTVKDELSAVAEGDESDDTFYNETEEGGIGTIENGTYKFYYKTENEEDGITCISSFDTAYGFELGEVIVTVKEALSGVKYVEEDINEDNAFFLFVPIEGKVLKCEFQKNTIVFVFENNALCATAIFENDF